MSDKQFFGLQWIGNELPQMVLKQQIDEKQKLLMHTTLSSDMKSIQETEGK
jgi:hypothetical protein